MDSSLVYNENMCSPIKNPIMLANSVISNQNTALISKENMKVTTQTSLNQEFSKARTQSTNRDINIRKSQKGITPNKG